MAINSYIDNRSHRSLPVGQVFGRGKAGRGVVSLPTRTLGD